MAIAYTNLYWAHEDRSPENLQAAKQAIETAERLSPGLPEASLARGFYHYWGFLEYDKALAEFATAAEGLPNNALVLAGMGFVKRRQGKLAEAVDYFRQATELDPLSNAAGNVSITLRFMRQYEEAERVSRRLLQREPTNATLRGNLARMRVQAEGDVAGACAVVEEAADMGLKDPELNRAAFSPALIAGCDPQLTRRYLNALGPTEPAIDDQFRYWPREMAEAWIHKLAGDEAAARASLEQARAALEVMARERPDDARIPSALGQVYAAMGRKDDAIREGLRGVEMLPYEKEALRGGQRVKDLAEIYAVVGEPELAVERLEFLLGRPTAVSVALLEVDPVWDSIRRDSEFQALLAE